VPRLGRLLVGAVLALFLLGAFARSVQYVYTRYAQPAEAGLVGLLEYLFRPREQPRPPTPAPPMRGPLSADEIAACAAGEFPVDYFQTIPIADENDAALRGYFSRILCALGELPLSRPGAGLARVRVVWLPSFRPGGAVRIEHSQIGSGIARVDLADLERCSSIRGGQRTEHPISADDWAGIQRAIEKASFWEVRSHDMEAGTGVMDGPSWLVEVSEPGRYHMVSRVGGDVLGDLPRYLYRISRSPSHPNS